MCTVVKQFIRSFTVFTALIITLITRVRGHHFRTCGSDELAQCAKPLSVVTDSGLTNFVTSKSDFDTLCPDLREALRCIHEYTRFCMNLHQKKHFRKLFHGTRTMVHELCNNETYQGEYLKYSPCMKQVQKENEACFHKYSSAMNNLQATVNTEGPIIADSELEDVSYENYQKKKRETADHGIKSVCCSFQEYIACSTHTIRKACGEDAALFSRDFLDKMSSSMIKMHCTNFGATECGFHHYKGESRKMISEIFHSELSSASIPSSNTMITLCVLTLVSVLFR